MCGDHELDVGSTVPLAEWNCSDGQKVRTTPALMANLDILVFALSKSRHDFAQTVAKVSGTAAA